MSLLNSPNRKLFYQNLQKHPQDTLQLSVSNEWWCVISSGKHMQTIYLLALGPVLHWITSVTPLFWNAISVLVFLCKRVWYVYYPLTQTAQCPGCFPSRAQSIFEQRVSLKMEAMRQTVKEELICSDKVPSIGREIAPSVAEESHYALIWWLLLQWGKGFAGFWYVCLCAWWRPKF